MRDVIHTVEQLCPVAGAEASPAQLAPGDQAVA
jgi:hypothetical protein